MRTVLLNRQRAVPVDRAGLLEFLERLAARVPAGRATEWTVCLFSERRMRELNRRFRDRDRATDVLSFPADGDQEPDGSRPLGDVAISVPHAQRRAREVGRTLAGELRELALHGYLHLLGYDHETDDGEMMRLQARLVRELGAEGRRP